MVMGEAMVTATGTATRGVGTDKKGVGRESNREREKGMKGGGATNGVNGTGGGGEHIEEEGEKEDDGEEANRSRSPKTDIRVPTRVIVEGTKIIREALEDIVDIVPPEE